MFNNQSKNEVWYTWLIILVFAAFIWVINAGIDISEALISGVSAQYGFILVNELTAALMIPLLFPILLWGFKKYPIQKKNFLRIMGFHLFMAVLYGLCHTSLMILSRDIIYYLLNWPDYNPGVLQYRYLMEFQKQFPLYWFTYGIFSLFQYIRRNQQRQIQTSVLEKQLSEARLKALKMQLNPHFLFNTLNMISSVMYENIEKADRMIVHLCDLLRLTLNTQDHHEVPLKHEVKILNLYLSIMKARFENSLKIKVEIEKSTEKALVPVLLLQPLVENSIKHSSNRTDHVTQILVSSRKTADRLQLTVRDNGPGLPTDLHKPAKDGIGLKTTRDRLSQLYGGKHEFKMENLERGGLEVEMIIPFTRGTGRIDESEDTCRR